MIEKLQLKNFTCFADTTFEFSKGINVLIGENGTGKTHVLKTILSLMEFSRDSALFTYFIHDIFKVKDYSALVRGNYYNAKWGFTFNGIQSNFQLFKAGDTSIESKYYEYGKEYKVIYIPSKETLSFHNGFMASYEKRELGFDYTYYLLAKALSVNPFKKEYAQQHGLLEFISELKEVLGGAEVINENGRFYLKEGEQKTEINLVAEGWRKIATLIYLILNGELELNENMVLLIDEPEANLNPKLIKVMADFLRKLANKGVQIFIATHSYLLSHYLSWNTEYKDKMEDPAEVRFFGLIKSEDGIDVDMADTILDIEKDPIAESYLDYYRKEEGILMEDEEEYKTE